MRTTGTVSGCASRRRGSKCWADLPAARAAGHRTVGVRVRIFKEVITDSQLDNSIACSTPGSARSGILEIAREHLPECCDEFPDA